MISAPRHRCGGGIAIVYRQDIPLQHNRKIEKFNTFEVMEATLNDGHQLWRFVNIYRAPYSKKHRFTILHFLEEFDQYLSLLRSKNGTPIIVGDFNIHVEKEDDINTIHFQNLLSEFQLEQCVPHFATHNEGGTLDLVVTDINHKINSIEIIGLGTSSDHYFVSVDSMIVLQHRRQQYTWLNYRRFKDIDVPDFRIDLRISGISDTSNFKSLDEATVLFNNVLAALMDKHCPVIKRKIRSKATEKDQTSGWFDVDLRNLRRRRRAAERLKHKCSTPENRQNYINICNSFDKQED